MVDEKKQGRLEKEGPGFTPLKKSHSLGFLLICIGIFIFPYALRGDALGSVAAVNLIALAGLALLLFYGNVHKLRPKRSGEVILSRVLIFFLFLFMLLFSYLFSDTKAGIAFLCSSVIPLVLIFSNIDNASRCLRLWCGFFSFIMILLVACAIMNWLTENELSRFLANYFHSDTYTKLAEEGRFVSFLGHPLTTSFSAICYVVSMFVYSQRIRKLNPLIYYLLGGVVVLASASITGALVLLFLFFVQNYRAGNYPFILVAVIIVLALWAFGILNPIIDRIITNLANGDITSGRNVALLRLMSNGDLAFHLFDWQIFSSENATLVAATEYPFFRLSYRFGLIAATCYCLVAFVVPLIYAIRCKKIDLWCTALGLVLIANTFDGVVSSGDLCWIYSITMMFLIRCAREAKRVGEPTGLAQSEVNSI